MSETVIGGSGEWAGKWGQLWGCSPDVVQQVTLLDICVFYLWWQHKDHPNIEKLLCQVAAIIFSRLDVKLQAVIANRGVDFATGGELDNWGALVNQKRNGASDLLYRAAIKAKARASVSSGNIGDLFETATLASPESDPQFREVYPACIRMSFSAAISNQEREILFELTKQAKAAGVCLQFIEVDPAGHFQWSYLNDDLSKDPVEHHWQHTDGDIPDAAGMAYLVE